MVRTVTHERRNLDGYPAAINRIYRWIFVSERTVMEMAEYIDRGVALDLVATEFGRGERGLEKAYHEIFRYPAADVREVILCGECYLHTHCRTEDVFDFAGLRDENRFCSVGKRKTNGAQMTDVPDADVGEFAKDTVVPGNTVRIIDRGGIGLYNGQLVTNPNRPTNADRIRSMSDEELADKFRWLVCPFYWVSLPDETDRPADWSCKQNCHKCWLDWLKSPLQEVPDA